MTVTSEPAGKVSQAPAACPEAVASPGRSSPSCQVPKSSTAVSNSMTKWVVCWLSFPQNPPVVTAPVTVLPSTCRSTSYTLAFEPPASRITWAGSASGKSNVMPAERVAAKSSTSMSEFSSVTAYFPTPRRDSASCENCSVRSHGASPMSPVTGSSGRSPNTLQPAAAWVRLKPLISESEWR